ncbi:SDR family oxidoreductase [Flagellatimonas centrodinii]|uniref:SDR family oxidoreductase n=1 Tax=Flagellatimonas centrodinii TaxID=2806210 RepID=UPI001FED5407|nr:SDR family oxidoreductase [Flagellatimonas centrodinii]ULQ46225.1 SDR family oxidoreductase [Flagellatimonas centrodinii]
MKIENAVVLVTGANRGLGQVFARAALARGARKVYAAVRDPASVQLARVTPVKLDVTRPEDVARAAAECGDVTLVINNAGIAHFGGFFADHSIDEARQQLETNFFGPLRVSRAFAPILAANGGGAILNVLSVASWLNGPLLGVYAATKSAAWGLTNGMRMELAAQGTQVTGLHVGFVDTDLTRDLDVPKLNPTAVVDAAFDGLEAGEAEILVDDFTRAVKRGLSETPAIYVTGPQPVRVAETA